MRRPNIVLIVLDTLRDDYSRDLDKLLEMGFVKMEAFATSSWTLPSHVSMFTSELPSNHGVREYKDIDWRELMRISRSRLGHDTIMETLKREGYTTYGYSANLFVTPQFGFVFDKYGLFNQAGEIRESSEPLQSTLVKRFMPLLFRKGILGGVLRGSAVGLGKLLKALGVQKLEKGSKPIMDTLSRTRFEEPFFAFVNLMEAHQPYVWWILDTLVVRLSLLGFPPRAAWWKEMYPKHSALSVSRGLEIVSTFIKHDPLIIVTSDHGQLLGDDGRYGHGFSLDEALLKVPLYVRAPRGWEVRAEGPVISLTEVAKIIEAASRGETYGIGAEYAMAESWGEGNYKEGGIVKDGSTNPIFLGRVGMGHVRVIGRKGSVVVSTETGAIEETTLGLSSAEAEELARMVRKTTTAEPEHPAAGSASEDEQLILGRLKQLGYE